MTTHPRYGGEHPDPSQATKDWIDTKINAMRSEMRLLFVVAVAGNQLLSHVSLSPTVGYITNAAVLLGAFGIKAFSLWRM
jgi:hypothetical protein